MAQREANYIFTYRIADRDNDKIVFDSQDRKIQETDSNDVIWDEIVGKEEYPEDCDGYKFQETDLEAFIRDENCEKEEYPGNCSVIYPSPPCYDEYKDGEWYSWMTGCAIETLEVRQISDVKFRKVDEFIYPSPPVYDVYRDEEWYSWVAGSGQNLLGGKLVDVGEDTVDDDLKTAINFNEFLSGEKLGDAVVIGGVGLAMGVWVM